MIVEKRFIFTVIKDSSLQLVMLPDKMDDSLEESEKEFDKKCKAKVKKAMDKGAFINVAELCMIAPPEQRGQPMRMIDMDNLDFAESGSRQVSLQNVTSYTFTPHKDFVKQMDAKAEAKKSPSIIKPPKGMKIPDHQTAEQHVHQFNKAEANLRRGGIIT